MDLVQQPLRSKFLLYYDWDNDSLSQYNFYFWNGVTMSFKLSYLFWWDSGQFILLKAVTCMKLLNYNL